MSEINKIVFIGMENAGKTSIINILSQQITDYSTIKPTIKVERTIFNFLGKEIIAWDFGGQVKYREKYLEVPDKYFNNISFLYFVVDVQDPEKLFLSTEYFKKINDGLSTFSPDAHIILLFHKNDPEAQLQISTLQIEKKFLDIIKPLIDPMITKAKREGTDSITFFHTSIYDPMTIIKAISEPLLGKKAIIQTVSDILKTFINVNGLQYSMIMSKDHLEIGKANAPNFLDKDKNGVLTYFLKYIILNPEIQVEMGFRNDTTLQVFMYGFEITHRKVVIPLYLIVIYNRSKGFPNRDSVLKTFEENFIKLAGSMNLLELYQHGK